MLINIFFSAFLYLFLGYPVINASLPRKSVATPAQFTNISCTYRLTCKLDTAHKYMTKENFRLLISGSKSIFRSAKEFTLDSITDRYRGVGSGSGLLDQLTESISKAPIPEFTYRIYKDTSVPKVVYVDEIEPGTKYAYNEPVDLFTWHIESITATVNGYTCQRATTHFRGRHFTAWFTKQIPIADGPYKFSGLPGLIVRVNDAKDEYNFELASLTTSRLPFNVDMPKKTVLITRDKFRRALANFNVSFIDRAAQYGITYSDPAAARANWKERLSLRNNMLELQ